MTITLVAKAKQLTRGEMPGINKIVGGAMKNFLIIFALTFTLVSFSNETKVGVCDVNRVFAGDSGTHIILENCSKNLGFEKKTYSLPHHQPIVIEEVRGNIIERVRFDNVGDVLGIKQTAELAYLFKQKLQVEVNKSNELIFVSLSGQISLPKTNDKPNSPPANPQPPVDDGFRPVPPTRMGGEASKKS